MYSDPRLQMTVEKTAPRNSACVLSVFTVALLATSGSRDEGRRLVWWDILGAEMGTVAAKYR